MWDMCVASTNLAETSKTSTLRFGTKLSDCNQDGIYIFFHPEALAAEV